MHRNAQRYAEAIDLFADAGAWDQVLTVIRDAAIAAPVFAPADFGRWHRLLPQRLRDEPAALLATGLERMHQDPIEAVAPLTAAVAGFRDADDIDGPALGPNNQCFAKDTNCIVSGRFDTCCREAEGKPGAYYCH